MPDYGLFLKYKFNDANGLFLQNKKPRHPDCRFWDEVLPDPANPGSFITRSIEMVQDPNNPGGGLIPQSTRINADTKTMEMVARSASPTDKVYFAINFAGGGAAPTLRSVTFSCGLNPGISFNAATVATPFRSNTEMQCLLTSSNLKKITSVDPDNPTAPPDVYDAIGAYELIKDPIAPLGSSCFYKLTVVASSSRGTITNREFSYDPDMDIEMSL